MDLSNSVTPRRSFYQLGYDTDYWRRDEVDIVVWRGVSSQPCRQHKPGGVSSAGHVGRRHRCCRSRQHRRRPGQLRGKQCRQSSEFSVSFLHTG